MGAPTPRRLYVHDDLSEELARHGEEAPTRRLGQALFSLLAREPDRVVVLTPAAQIAALIEPGGHRPFGAAVAIGAAGAATAAGARLLSARGRREPRGDPAPGAGDGWLRGAGPPAHRRQLHQRQRSRAARRDPARGATAAGVLRAPGVDGRVVPGLRGRRRGGPPRAARAGPRRGRAPRRGRG